MSLIKLPVSIGEAIDKLTILDIKCQMIKDSRREDCIKEFDMLFDELKKILIDNLYYYNTLKYINLKIWKDQDIIRDITDNDLIGKLANKILKDNDARFRIKKIINDSSNSVLKEQKSYAKTRAVFLSHMGMGDLINLNGSIRYVSIMYDEVILFTPSQYEDNVKQMFNDLTNIKYMIVNKDYLYTNLTKDAIEKSTNTKIDAIYKSGYQIDRSKNMDRIPLSFYEDMDLDIDIMKVFFKIDKEIIKKSEILRKMLEEKGYEFIFCHLMGGLGDINSYDFIKTGLDKIKDKYLVIDIKINRYEKDHKFYDIANLFIGLPIFQYYDIMKKAKEIHVVNSSFYCLASRICDNEEQKRICYCDSNLSYLDEYFGKWEYVKINN
jgi:hypothetical protein